MPRNEYYDQSNHTFRPYQKGDKVLYDMPDQAFLDIQEQTGSLGLPVKGVVTQTPATWKYFHKGFEQNEIGYFPPEGMGVLLEDGSCEPANLRELILERINLGWTVSPSLAELLKL